MKKFWIKRLSCILLLIIGFFIIPTYFKKYYSEFFILFPTIGSLVITATFAEILTSSLKPFLEILNEPDPISFNPPCIGDYGYIANRIIVKNTGLRAAKNCKAYLIYKKRKERVCWSIPNERPFITINARGEESVDFCAMQNTTDNVALRPRIIFPTENGWEDCRKPQLILDIDALSEEKIQRLEKHDFIDPDAEFKVLVTAENADSISRKVKLNIKEALVEIV